ncbi:lysis system o-spanin lipoprotein Rz1 [Pantoea sp. BAV 3049]
MPTAVQPQPRPPPPAWMMLPAPDLMTPLNEKEFSTVWRSIYKM